MKDSFTDYKLAIKTAYEEIKMDRYASFLIRPTSARIRDLCIMMLREKKNEVDYRIFKHFLGFEFDATNTKKLQAETEKFRPLATFLRGETELADFNAADMLAVLIDFQPRPYARFLKNGDHTAGSEKMLFDDALQGNGRTSEELPMSPSVGPESRFQISRGKYQKFYVSGIFLLVALLAGYVVTDSVFQKNECMQWNADHYEIVDCEVKGIWQANNIEPFDEARSRLRKIAVTRSTEFFRNETPLVWYIRKDGKCEFYNQGGVHPITGKTLLPISKYMILKHVH